MAHNNHSEKHIIKTHFIIRYSSSNLFYYNSYIIYQIARCHALEVSRVGIILCFQAHTVNTILCFSSVIRDTKVKYEIKI